MRHAGRLGAEPRRARPPSGWERAVVVLAAWLLLANAVALALVSPAMADVVEARAEGFTSRHVSVMPTRPDTVWQALVDWQAWWDPAHSYSGTAGAMRLYPQAGGALVERWPGGSVEHARVLAALPPSQLRLQGGFGPLQGLPVTAVLEFAITTENDNTRLVMTYRVAGSPGLKLDTLAGEVDGVMGAAFDRLVTYANTGQKPRPQA